MPDETPIVAIVGFELDQVPPVTGLLSVVVPPSHMANVPVIGGNAANADNEIITESIVRLRYLITVCMFGYHSIIGSATQY